MSEQENTKSISQAIDYIIYTGRTPMCNPLMCNIVPNVQHFFEEIVFCLVSPMCNTQEKFQLQNAKNERKWVEHGFQNDKIDL